MTGRGLAQLLHPRTIRGKLALLSLGALLLAVALVFAFTLIQQQRLIRSEWAASIAAQARLIATNSQAAVAFLDRNEAQRLLGAVDSNPAILRARLLLGDGGKPFAEFARPALGKPLELPVPPNGAGVQFVGSRLMAWAPVPGNEAVVELTVSLEAMHGAMLRSALETGFALLLALGFSLWLSTRVVRRLAAPVEDMSALMARIAGNAALLDRVHVQGDDEIAELGRGLNTMIDTLQARDRELAQYREGLEQLVEQRTRELMQVTDEARRASRAKSDFLARMSHEIRTPMNAIVGLGKLLLKTRLDARQRDYQEKVLAASDALLGVINDVLDYSRIEAGKLALESIAFDLDQVMQNVSSQVALRAQEKGLELLFLVDGGVPRRLIGDPLRLGQVLVNLASNAVKFTDRGEVVVRVELARSRVPGSIALRFSVRDTGMGIPVERQAELFAPFTQVDGSITRRFGGSGLGLAICKQLVEMMGGSIGVNSMPGAGSTFHFLASFGLSSEQAQPAGHSSLLQGRRVLVVDDNASAREVLCAMLDHFGMRAEAVPDGAAAIVRLQDAAAAGEPFQLVLLDWLMPGMDGIETARRINAAAALPGGVPAVLMITAGSYDKLADRLMAVGLDRVLAKPVSESSLHDAILEVLLGSGVADDYRRSLTRYEGAQHDFSAIRNAPVLLVDDVELNRIVAMAFLRQAGVRVDVAVHGRDALNKIAAKDYALVLMDIQMPEMDGLAATREIRKDPRHHDLPIVAMTAHAMSGDRERSLAAGMNDHLTKPIDPEALFAALLRWIRPRQETGADADAAAIDALLAEADAEIEIPVLAGIDTARGLANNLGRPALYLRILTGFVKEFGDCAGSIDAALARNDHPEARRLAHSLKSAAAMIGAGALAELARTLEEAFAAGGRAADMQAACAAELARVVAVLRPLADEQAEGRPAGAVEAPVPGRLGELVERLALLLKNDDAAASRVCGELEAGIGDPGLRREARELHELIDDVEYEAALLGLERLRAALAKGEP
ncbi:MAG: response regulator [Pseudomonadota bacterium]